MSTRADVLETRFFADAEEYLSRGTELAKKLARLADDGTVPEEIHELFRCVHSIKSEAAYLKYETVGRLAHELEEKLERIRSGEVENLPDEGIEIENRLDSISRAIAAERERNVSETKTVPVDFNKFELKLLEEAGRRGERCYRAVFEIDHDAQMKRARAYLVLSNLEQIATVIRTDPLISTTEASQAAESDEEESTYTCYLTAAVGEAEIYSALDVDQVARSSLDALEFSAGGGGLNAMREESGDSRPRDSASFYRLTGRKLDQLTAYADDLRLNLRELELDAGTSKGAAADELGKLNTIANGLYDELRKIRVASLNEEYPIFRELVADLAERLGKKVDFKTEGGELTLDRRILAALADPISHLLRNAVDHGIETPEERTAAGKNDNGSVSVVAREEADRLKITVSDDGIGIDVEALRAERGKTEGRDDLFGMLSAPGYTTLNKATDLSGRGVGLDLVARRVEEVGGEIRAYSKSGEGIAFEISVQKGPSYALLLFFRFGNELFAVSDQAVTDIRRIQKGDLKRDAKGMVFYSKIPAFAGKEPAKIGKIRSYGSFAVIVSYLGHQGCMLADDVLFEHEVDEELLAADDMISDKSRRMAVSFGSEKREFILLPASLVRPKAT